MSFLFIAVYIIIILVLLGISAFFSGSETALTAISKSRLHHAANQGEVRAKRVVALLKRKEQLLGTILLGNTMVNIFASALATTLFMTLFGEAGVLFSTFALTFIIVIFGEVLPKSYAIVNPDKIARRSSFLMNILMFLLHPLTLIIQYIVSGILSLFGLKHAYQFNHEDHEEELRGAIDLHRGENPDIGHERHMMKSILDLDQTTVADVMTHRRNVEMINLDLTPFEILDQLFQSRYTRLPLYKGEPDNIIGVIHGKSILKAIHNQQKSNSKNPESNPHKISDENRGIDLEAIDLEKLASTPWFIPESTSLMDQLLAFRERREHFAMVVDEYGSLEGIVTLEDVLEQIVGNIDDETDIRLAGVKIQEDGSYLVDGAVTLHSLERDLEWHFPNEEVVTLAGLILHEAKRIPAEGQIFTFHNFRFVIKKKVRNQIKEIIVTPPHPVKKASHAT